MPSHLWCSARFSSRAPTFILYTTQLSSLIKASSIDHHLYADDTQLFISFSTNSFSDSMNHLLHVVYQISSWMTSNLLRLNPSKTEFLLIGLRDRLKKIPDPSISLKTDSASNHTFTPTSPVRNLGVIFFTRTLVSRTTSLSFLALASCISAT